MDSIAIFTTAVEYEKKIRDLYTSAISIIDDERGKAIFKTLAAEEQSHIDFLEHSIETLKGSGTISLEQLKTSVPDTDTIQKNIDAMKMKIPEHMLGDIKEVLRSALRLEIETTEYYQQSFAKTEGIIQSVMGKFVEIEQRHTDVVRFELDNASKNGFWYEFPEKDMEEGW